MFNRSYFRRSYFKGRYFYPNIVVIPVDPQPFVISAPIKNKLYNLHHVMNASVSISMYANVVLNAPIQSEAEIYLDIESEKHDPNAKKRKASRDALKIILLSL